MLSQLVENNGQRNCSPTCCRKISVISHLSNEPKIKPVDLDKMSNSKGGHNQLSLIGDS